MLDFLVTFLFLQSGKGFIASFCRAVEPDTFMKRTYMSQQVALVGVRSQAVIPSADVDVDIRASVHLGRMLVQVTVGRERRIAFIAQVIWPVVHCPVFSELGPFLKCLATVFKIASVAFVHFKMSKQMTSLRESLSTLLYVALKWFNAIVFV